MSDIDRRTATALLVAGMGATVPLAEASADSRRFLDVAERMKTDAVAAGDQPFGAVVVLNGSIVGYGPSRVVVDRNDDAHAERVALWDAQRRLGRRELDGAVIYSTSRPCAACQRALAEAAVSRMIHGREAIDSGPPRR